MEKKREVLFFGINTKFIMKKFLLPILMITLIICFLNIQISYNGIQSSSIFFVFVENIKIGLTISSQITNPIYPMFLFILISGSLLWSSFYSDIKKIIIGSLFFLIFWFIILHIYSYYMDRYVYVKSSISFFIILILIFIISIYRIIKRKYDNHL